MIIIRIKVKNVIANDLMNDTNSDNIKNKNNDTKNCNCYKLSDINSGCL